MANYDIFNRYDIQVVLKVIENGKPSEILIQPKATVKVRDMELVESSVKRFPRLHIKNLDATTTKTVAKTTATTSRKAVQQAQTAVETANTTSNTAVTTTDPVSPAGIDKQSS